MTPAFPCSTLAFQSLAGFASLWFRMDPESLSSVFLTESEIQGVSKHSFLWLPHPLHPKFGPPGEQNPKTQAPFQAQRHVPPCSGMLQAKEKQRRLKVPALHPAWGLGFLHPGCNSVFSFHGLGFSP